MPAPAPAPALARYRGRPSYGGIGGAALQAADSLLAART